MSGFWWAGAVTFTEMFTTAGVTSRSSGASVGTPSRVGSGSVPAAATDGSNSRRAAMEFQRGVIWVRTGQWLSTIGYPTEFSRQIAFPQGETGLEIIIQIPILRIPVTGPSRINEF